MNNDTLATYLEIALAQRKRNAVKFASNPTINKELQTEIATLQAYITELRTGQFDITTAVKHKAGK